LFNGFYEEKKASRRNGSVVFINFCTAVDLKRFHLLNHFSNGRLITSMLSLTERRLECVKTLVRLIERIRVYRRRFNKVEGVKIGNLFGIYGHCRKSNKTKNNFRLCLEYWIESGYCAFCGLAAVGSTLSLI